MKKNSVCVKILVVVMAVGGVLCTSSADAAPITVSNHSFESGLTDWTKIGNFGFHASDNGLDPRPDGTSTNAFTNGGQLYQELSTAVQANTKYSLTVDIGDRTDTGFPVDITELRLGVGTNFGENLLLMTGETRPVPDGGWELWTVTFESGASPAAGNLRIEFLGNLQSQFDNVRLDAVASSFDPSSPWEAYVRNHTFEYEGNAFWSGSIGGPYLTTDNPTWYDPSPDPDDGEYIVHVDTATGYQVLDTVRLEADTTYELTVDIGDRNGLNFVGAELRMGTGSTVGNSLLTATVVSNAVPDNVAPGNVDTTDGWETYVSAFTAGSGVVGDPLRIEVVSSGQRTHWDNVRLSVTPDPPAGTVFSIQ